MVDEHPWGILAVGMIVHLILPITHHADWADNESRGSCAWCLGLGTSQDQRNDLDCFPQTHIVSQDAATRQGWGVGRRIVCCNVPKLVAVALPKLHHVIGACCRMTRIFFIHHPRQPLTLIRKKLSRKGRGHVCHGHVGQVRFTQAKVLCDLADIPGVEGATLANDILQVFLRNAFPSHEIRQA